MAAGCQSSEDISSPPNVSATKKDNSSVCTYWKCSATGKLYMQKYEKQKGLVGFVRKYKPAGTYKLGEGIGVFPLEDLDKYSSDGNAVSVNNGFNPCPYCENSQIVGCRCGKTYCEKNGATSGTCPWCGKQGSYSIGTWNTGRGG
ncbi:hypothetical protein FACS189454_02590 [Planctomycetales bacterium]|nr:hypothetical protein FACS189454_02590 [Planctomycetales bacterium]